MKKYKFTILLLLTFVIAFPVITVKLVSAEQEKKARQEELAQVADTERETPETAAGTKTGTKKAGTDKTGMGKADTDKNTKDSKKNTEDKTDKKDNETVADTEQEGTFTTEDVSYFSDALFIGDSRTVGLSEYADLGDADVFATIGLSSFKLFETQVDMPGYGKETLDEVLSRKNYGKIYLMLGINELGYPHASIEKQYREIVEKIREKQPDAILFLEASLHVSKAKSDSDSLYNNANIDWLNGVVESLCDQKQTYYIDVNEVFDDGAGNLDAQYTSDDAHPLGKYYAQWAEWILTKAIVKEK